MASEEYSASAANSPASSTSSTTFNLLNQKSNFSRKVSFNKLNAKFVGKLGDYQVVTSNRPLFLENLLLICVSICSRSSGDCSINPYLYIDQDLSKIFISLVWKSICTAVHLSWCLELINKIFPGKGIDQ